MLFIVFINYFTTLKEIQKYNPRQIAKSGYYHHSFNKKFGRKQLDHVQGLKIMEIYIFS